MYSRHRYLPTRLCAAVAGLNDSQLDTPYRDGGWTVRQVVHHLADSHANSVIRFKLALTEDWPTIKPYDENAWAQLSDSKSLPVDSSLTFISAMHERWVALLESMSEPISSAAMFTQSAAGRICLGVGHLCVARTPPYGAHNGIARTQKLVGIARGL